MILLYFYRNIISILREIMNNIPRTLVSSFGIIFLITFMVLSISLKNSISDFMETRIFGKLKINQIRITPINTTTFVKFSSDTNEIERDKVRRVRGIAEIENIHEVLRLNYPSYIKAGMLGRYLRSDMLISGVDKSFFKDTMKNWRNFKTGDYVPVVIPEFAINLYNNFAATNGLPEIGEKAIEMLTMDIYIGRSSFFKTSKEILKYEAKIFGFTSAVTTAGIIVPDDFIKKFCRENMEAKERDKCYSCIAMLADVKERNKIPAVTEKIKKMNLNVESQADIADKTERAVKLIDVILGLLLGTILILTVIAIFNSYLAITYNRSDKISIQRMLGASKMRIVLIYIVEAAIVGAFYGGVGYFLGYYLVNTLSGYIDKWVPILAGLDLRLDDHSLFYAALSLSALVSSLSALIPGLFAANLNLFKASKK